MVLTDGGGVAQRLRAVAANMLEAVGAPARLTGLVGRIVFWGVM